MRATLKIHPDVSRGIVEGAAEEGADLLVVGNVGMAGRTEFLLGNVPNRVSHSARCSVVIVNTGDGATPSGARPPEAEPEVEGRLLGRAAHIGRVLVKHGLEARRGAREPQTATSMKVRAAAPARCARGARPDLRQARPDPLDPA